MSGKHTKGPWEIRGQSIVGKELNGHICTWSGRTADSHLIAAAPDMLEALDRLVQWHDKYCGHSRPKSQIFIALDKARQAIAAAKGEKV